MMIDKRAIYQQQQQHAYNEGEEPTETVAVSKNCGVFEVDLHCCLEGVEFSYVC